MGPVDIDFWFGKYAMPGGLGLAGDRVAGVDLPPDLPFSGKVSGDVFLLASCVWGNIYGHRRLDCSRPVQYFASGAKTCTGRLP